MLQLGVMAVGGASLLTPAGLPLALPYMASRPLISRQQMQVRRYEAVAFKTELPTCALWSKVFIVILL